MNLIAKLPSVAAAIYRNTYKDRHLIAPKEGLDWAGNLAVQMGLDARDTAALDMMRMYQTIHTGAPCSSGKAHQCGSQWSTLVRFAYPDKSPCSAPRRQAPP